MIEIKNIKKIYKTQGGGEVRALDDVSIKFPEKGLVFLLGKSGSGKSTMLNLIGGLDRPDEGELIVEGCNSKDFTQADFDSYRNTYVGIVFQEFNILEEFSIGTNISIALQLQNKRNDKEAVNDILKLVELDGMADRKPGTLSGGQKQRVAIARAIIKDPEIVLADEPTGALDSRTGEQIFNTLKKLSTTRLVVVVSHDRESAEKYADRIIELADGKVINDVVKINIDAKPISQNVDVLGDSTIKIKNVDNLSNEDLSAIITQIRGSGKEAILTYNENVDKVKKVCKIKEDGKMDGFKKTKVNDLPSKQENTAQFVKAKLPFFHAVRLGASSFRKNAFRFVITILLSVVAFCVFGAVSTLMLYKPNYSFAKALEEMNYQSVMMDKYYTYTKETYSVASDWTESQSRLLTARTKTLYGQEELAQLNNNNVGLDFAGVFTFKSPIVTEVNSGFKISGTFHNEYAEFSEYYSYRSFIGFTDCGEQFMQRNGFNAYGRYPETSNEIAISNYVYELLKIFYGITDYTQEEFLYLASEGVLQISVDIPGLGVRQFRIVGIYEISDFSRFDGVKSSLTPGVSYATRTRLLRDFKEIIGKSMDLLAFVSTSFYDEYIDEFTVSTPLEGVAVQGFVVDENKNALNTRYYYTEKTVEQFSEKFEFYDVDGNVTKAGDLVLPEDGVFVSYSKWQEYVTQLQKTLTGEALRQALKEKTVFATYKNNSGVNDQKLTLNVLGYYKLVGSSVLGYDFIVNEQMLKDYSLKRVDTGTKTRDISEYKVPDDAKYNYVIAMSDNTLEQVDFMLKDDGLVEYTVVNDAYNRIFGGEVVNTMARYKKIFLIVGAVTTAFSALMLMNFISSSINAKRKEIGILRAVGAGKSDIFKIFFTETFLLAIISFILAGVGAYFVTAYINNILYLLTYTHLLRYGIINLVLILFISVFISFASTVVPVYKEANKLPVDSIRQL